MALEKMMTPREAAEYLQIHPKTLVKFANEGKIPGKKIGHCWRFAPSVLARFINTVDATEKKS